MTVTLLLVDLLLLFVAYYLMKTVREPLILASGSAELRAYATGAQALALAGFVPLYGWVAGRVGRLRLLLATNGFFLAVLQGFVFLTSDSLPYVGFAFFVWLGVFVGAVVAQFWSFATDIFETDTGERLFPVVAIGATIGAPLGAKLAGELFAAGVPAWALLQIAAGALALHLLLTWIVHRRVVRRGLGPSDRGAVGPTAIGNGFALVFRDRYVLAITGLLIVLNLVNTTGEYILSKLVKARAEAGTDGSEAAVEAAVGAFYGDFYFYVNLATFLVQALLASRLVRRFGIAGILFVLPMVSMGTYGAIASGVGFVALAALKAAENTVDYSLMNTGKAMLWLPTSRAEKYNARQAVDTFFVRLGDLLAAGLVFVGASVVGAGIRWFAVWNLGLVALWLGLTVWLVRRNRQRRAAPGDDAPAQDPRGRVPRARRPRRRAGEGGYSSS